MNFNKPDSSIGLKVGAIRRPLVLGVGLTVLVLGSYTFYRYRTQKKMDLAYQQTRSALLLLSKNLNHGLCHIGHLNQFEVAMGKIYKY